MKNSLSSLVPWYEQTHCSCTAFVFSVPMACVVDHDISRNESWRLINLGHLEWEGRALPIFYHIRCISVVPLLFIYFIKDAKKKNWKGFHLASVTVKKSLQYAFRSGASKEPACPGTAVDLPHCFAELNNGPESSKAATTARGRAVECGRWGFLFPR